ncbi:hypothetical protein BP5796_12538 [Coleophoma crateriformis]|uniref:Heterokaryon incompatibility domain-containing protein n=1 Tax=Coleophoma crateriformis TaxID=565419 RepID=A0A3D8Q7R8_9HELO|nr:hypothetical protein BP5796_12538 [Coleophoma crateriformis]
MSRHLPTGTVSRGRSAFAMIDPETELYSHKLGRAQHVVISYVWSEWQDGSTSSLPNWSLLRSRLLELVGASASSFMKIQTGNRRNCWLDSKCINQASAEDKAYWIPRMDEVYSEARCTVLLLRNIDLGPLVEAEKQLACDVFSMDIRDDNHNCLLTQICTSSTQLSVDLQQKAVETLKLLCEGTWRRRAWIFQEILLSDDYVISGENNSQLKLSDCGVLASFLSSIHPKETWLRQFADWCRRLDYLRLRYHNYSLCVANLLQMAQDLEATVEADKFYALCGLLRLKNLGYNGSHTSHQALQAIISELTRKGQMSWAYAFRPLRHSIEGSLCLTATRFSRYLDHNQSQNGSLYAKPVVTTDSIDISVVVLGIVEEVKAISQVLQQAEDCFKVHGTNFPPTLQYLAAMPSLIHKLVSETISPLLLQPLYGKMQAALQLSPKCSSADFVWCLYTLDTHKRIISLVGNHSPTQENSMCLEIATAASKVIRQQISSLEQDYAIVCWLQDSAQARKGKVKAEELPQHYLMAIGDRNVPQGSKICRVRGDTITLAARFEHDKAAEAGWGGALLPLHESQVVGSGTLVKRLKHWIAEPKPIRLKFNII